MKNIKLSDEDKKIINKYNHLLMAVVGDDGLFAEAYASQDENIYDFSGLYSRKSNELIQTQNEGYKLLSSIIEDFLDSIDFNDYLYCDTCSGYGSVNVIYDPFTSKFEVTLEVGEVISHDYSYVSTFEELKNTLEKVKVVLPTYSVLQDAIGSAIKNEENRVIQIVEKYLTPETEQALQSLFAIERLIWFPWPSW